ncbi:LacI family DNA-binding transcriptional regulator [Enterococcus sp. LJL128]
MTNIRDITRMAKVSVPTVSRVLNQHPHVSSETRQRINQIIAETNYIANKNAVNLSKGTSNTIGILIPYNNNSCYDELISSILLETKKYGYQVLLLPTFFEKDAESHYYSLLQKKVIDGLIVTYQSRNDKTIDQLASAGPVVLTEKSNSAVVSAIFPDRQYAYEEVFRHLASEGRKSVRFIVNRSIQESVSSLKKAETFKKYFGSFSEGVNYFPHIRTYEDGFELSKTLFSAVEKPDAIFSNGDEVAAGIIAGAKQIGYEHGSDFVVVGESNLPYSRLSGFSSIDFRQSEIGREAVQQLLFGKKPVHCAKKPLVVIRD